MNSGVHFLWITQIGTLTLERDVTGDLQFNSLRMYLVEPLQNPKLVYVLLFLSCFVLFLKRTKKGADP